MKRLKRLTTTALALLTAASMVLVIPAAEAPSSGASNAASASNDSQKGKTISYRLIPAMDGIKIKWKKQKASYCVVYRTEFKVKNYYDINPVPLSKYKKLKKISGRKNSYIDKSARRGRYYNYVVKGYKKSGGKAKLLFSTYKAGATNYQCAGLQRPELIDGGYGEDFSNGPKALYLYVQAPDGVMPDGVAAYRKTKGGKYRKVEVKKAEKGKFMGGKHYVDATVKPGKTYYYKVRTFVKWKGKKRYSGYSNYIKLSSLNFSGKYTAKAMTPAGETEEFCVRLKSGNYNGTLTLKGGRGYEGPVYSAKTGGKDYGSKAITLAAYSTDNKTWNKIPSKGLKIKPGKTVYLKFRFCDGASYFTARFGSRSIIDFMHEKVSYIETAAFGTTEFVIDLADGYVRAFQDFDN